MRVAGLKISVEASELPSAALPPTTTTRPSGSGVAVCEERAVESAAVLAQAAAALYDSSVQISDIALRRPTLDDVFLQFTGTHAEPSGGDEGETAAEAEVERV